MRCILCQTWQIFRLYFVRSPLLDVERSTPTPREHPPVDKPSDCADITLTVQYQTDLDIIGVGAAGQVYNVDEYTVLKACRIYEPPSSDATPRALWDYASETIFHFGLLKDEKTVFRLLTEHPHPNIIEAIDTERPEGIYLRKYRPFSDTTPTTQSDRVLWYRDIIRALLHLHSLGIAHSDIRKDNILFDANGHALLGDFGACCPFGKPNPSLPVLLNGPSQTVSDETDMFAMGCLIYELEIGYPAEISVDDHNCLILPQIHTGHRGLDCLIENAWRGQYNSTADMLGDAENLNGPQDNRGAVKYPVSKAELTERVMQWRKKRQEQHGSLTSMTSANDLG